MSLNMLSITLLLLLLVCIGVHTCVCLLCSYVQVLVSVWVYTEVRGNLLGCCSLGTIQLVFDFFRHSCSLVWSLPSRLSWLVSEHQLSTCLHLPSAWNISTCRHTWVLCLLVVLGFGKASEDWNQVPCLLFPGPVLVLLCCILNISFCLWPSSTPECTLSCLTTETKEARVQLIHSQKTFHSISNFGLRDQSSLEEPLLHVPCWFLCYFYAIDSEAKPFHAGEEHWIPIPFPACLWSLCHVTARSVIYIVQLFRSWKWGRSLI